MLPLAVNRMGDAVVGASVGSSVDGLSVGSRVGSSVRRCGGILLSSPGLRTRSISVCGCGAPLVVLCLGMWLW